MPYRQYQRTAQSTISPSKWRPLKSDTAWLHATSSHSDACRLNLQQSPLAYAVVIDDPSRFAKSSFVGAYLGLTPRR